MIGAFGHKFIKSVLFESPMLISVMLILGGIVLLVVDKMRLEPRYHDVTELPPSLAKASRKKPEQLAVLFEDLIKVLDTLGNGYRHGRYPNAQQSAKVASMLRAVADELEL